MCGIKTKVCAFVATELNANQTVVDVPRPKYIPWVCWCTSRVVRPFLGHMAVVVCASNIVWTNNLR